MIAKGKIRGEGAQLARYLMMGEDREIAQLVETRGLDAFGSDPVTAFDRMEQWAGENTRCQMPFFHGHIRLAPDERLADQQWMELLDRMEKRLGFAGQPRIVSFHVNEATGEKHLHAAWFRIDLEAERAIDPGMYKNHLMDFSRQEERRHALREISSQRKPQDRARAADRNELEESRRLGTDVRAIRTDILDCFQQSDSGKAFKAALEARDMTLANGDRRDCFVVIDGAGGHHALNKKLTGVTLAETRARLADLDRAQLPTVSQAKELQAERQAVRSAQEARRQRQPIPGVEAARGSYASLDAATVAKGRPLGQTAGEIRFAWRVTQTAGQFAKQLAGKGLILVHVSAEEAKASERAHDFAKAISRRNRPVREGFAVIDQRGSVTRIDQRTTGDQWEEIQKRLGGIDRADLATLAEARVIQHEANRAAFREKKQAERAEAQRNAPVTGRAAEIREAWNASCDPEPTKDAAHLETALAARGIGLAFVGAEEAYASERRAAFAKATGNFAPVWREGEIVAVDGYGSVHRLDERTTGQRRPEIDARLATIDRAALMNLDGTQEAMRAASLEAWKVARRAEREQARPASAIEKTIEVALRDTVTGTDFAAELDDKGLTVARVTARDVEALAALRTADTEAGTTGTLASGRCFADVIEGDLAAVTRQGDVFRLSPQKLDFDEIENRLADVQTRLPGVVEARALNEADRERGAEQRVRNEAEFVTSRLEQADTIAGQQELRQAVRGTESVVHAAAEMPVAAVADAASTALSLSGIAAKAFAGFFRMFSFGAMAEPKQTRQQMRNEAQAAGNVETQHAHEVAAGVQAIETARDWQQHAQKTTQQEQDLSLSARFGTPPTREANIGRERDDEYGRERERD